MASTPREKRRSDGTSVWIVQTREDDKPGRPTYTLSTRQQAELFQRLCERYRPLGKRDVCPSDEELTRFGLPPLNALRAGLLPGEAPQSEPEPAVTLVTVGRAMELYLEYREHGEAQDRPTDRTLREYHSINRNFLVGTELAGCDVATVESPEIQAWINQQKHRRRNGSRSGQGVSNSTMNKAMVLLSQMLKWSTQSKSSGLTGKPLRDKLSPFARGEIKQFKTGRDRSKEKKVLNKPDEYATFFRCAYAVDPWWADMLVVSALTGMRFGEVTALTVGQVDWRNRVLVVDRRFSQGYQELGTKGSTADGGDIIDRDARIPDSVWQIIVDKCAGKSPDALIFDGPQFSAKRRWVSSMDNRRWSERTPADSPSLPERLAEYDLDLGLRHHHLRHSLATYLRSNGIEESLRRGVLGHADKSVHDRYLHLTDEDWARVLKVLEPIAEPVMTIRTLAYREYLARQNADLAA